MDVGKCMGIFERSTRQNSARLSWLASHRSHQGLVSEARLVYCRGMKLNTCLPRQPYPIPGMAFY